MSHHHVGVIGLALDTNKEVVRPNSEMRLRFGLRIQVAPSEGDVDLPAVQPKITWPVTWLQRAC